MSRIAQFGMSWAALVLLCAIAAGDIVDLGDMAAGGNGLGTGEHGRGVRAWNGTAVPPSTYAGTNSGSAVFIRTDGSNGTAALPFVDGVFRPNGTTQISSAGLMYPFPPTSGGAWDAIRNGLAIVYTDNTPRTIQLDDQPGVDRPGVGLHANSGITYDLSKIRAAGFTFDAVRGVAGLNWDTVNQPATVEISVLVDGLLRYRTYFAQGVRTYEAFNVPLSPADHFLTLAATDANLLIGSDHAVIADAALIPEPAAALLALTAGLLLRTRRSTP